MRLRRRLRQLSGHGPGECQAVEIDVKVHIGVRAVLVKPEVFLPGLQIQNRGRPGEGYPVESPSDRLVLIRDAAPVGCIQVPVRDIVRIGEVNRFAATIKDITKYSIIAGGSATGADDARFYSAKLNRRVLRHYDQLIGDYGEIATINGDPPATMRWHVVGSAALAFGRLPDDVVVQRVALLGC